MRGAQGFTLVEVLSALAILAIIVFAALATMVRGSGETREAGLITQAARVISYIGDGLTSGDSRFFPTSGTSVSWDYGELKTSFPALAENSRFDPDLFKVTVTDQGVLSAAAPTGVNVHAWTVEVCFKSALKGGERCVSASTLAVPPGGGTP